MARGLRSCIEIPTVHGVLACGVLRMGVYSICASY